MSFLGMAAGILVLVVSVFAILFGLHAFDATFNGVASLRRDLARRGTAPVVIEAIDRDLARQGSSVVMPLLTFAGGIGGLVLASEWSEDALVPGLCLIAVSPLWLWAKSRRNRQGGPLYRAIFSEPSLVRLLVETRVAMPQLLPGSSTRYRLVSVPHVVVVTSLGEEILVEDDDAQMVLRALGQQLPSIPSARVPTWRAGLGTTLAGTVRVGSHA